MSEFKMAPAPGLTALSPEDLKALRRAYRLLEYPNLVARLTSRIGQPVEKALKALPESWSEGLRQAIQISLERALALAISSLGDERRAWRSSRYHKALGMLSGAAGGLFGLPAVLAELPITSTIMLRSIADIARSQGEDLNDPEVRLACLEVFALGSRSTADDATETGYYGIRLALAMHLSKASERMISQGVVQWNPPGLVRFIVEVAARFGVVVSEKTALQMVPLVGAGTGSLINLIFMEHFQDIARAHFTMRRLERRYGLEFMRSEYQKLRRRSQRPGAKP
jgi:hypothetical protein